MTPTIAEQVQPWRQEDWTNRVIAVNFGDYRVINIYSPNDHRAQEEFFLELQRWPLKPQETILAGDFNCVQRPSLNRLGG